MMLPKTMGYREFKLNWGNRKLEDHWQRSVKSSSAFGTGDETEMAEAETAAPGQYFQQNVTRILSPEYSQDRLCSRRLP